MANSPDFFVNPPILAPDSTLWSVRGWFTKIYRMVQANYVPANSQTAAFTVNPYIFFYPCDTTSAGFTATLPPAVSCIGKKVVIKKISSDGNTLTIGRSGSDLIDGATTKTTTTQYARFFLISDGVSNWWQIN